MDSVRLPMEKKGVITTIKQEAHVAKYIFTVLKFRQGN